MGEQVTDLADIRESIKTNSEELWELYRKLDGLEEDVTKTWAKWYIVEIRKKIQECIVLMNESVSWLK